ncbi:MAG: TraM recognition domain-containing protein, partial [Acidimicrobiales bacterium]|nr:TraM recognition domain-containing protein [Acidimicrobiales bacterium]
VVQPLKSTQRFSVVFGGLLGALLKDQAYEVAKRYRRPLPDLLCVIDEAGNTPLRWLPEVASTCAGIGVLLVTVWQSKAQIDAIYQAQAGPVLTNHGSKVIFAGVSDVETLEYVSYLAGEEEIAQRSSNADANLAGYRRGVADSTIHRRLLPAEVLRQAKPGQALLLHGTLPPAHLIGRRAWLDPRLRALATGEGPKPVKAEVAPDLVAALAFDPTPPIDVLQHLPGYSRADAGSESGADRNEPGTDMLPTPPRQLAPQKRRRGVER